MTGKSNVDINLSNIVDIYNGLSETKKAIWIGNGNLLFASQQAELEKVPVDNETQKT